MCVCEFVCAGAPLEFLGPMTEIYFATQNIYYNIKTFSGTPCQCQARRIIIIFVTHYFRTLALFGGENRARSEQPHGELEENDNEEGQG